MVLIRRYHESDAENVGRLIADTYREFNLADFEPELVDRMLGPFRHAGSADKAHREAIARVIRAPMVLVAEDEGEVVGVLRGGRQDRLQSLFVRKSHQRQGVGRKLVETFEKASREQGATVIRLAATVYAIPFYSSLGYKRSTGLRSGWSFDGWGLPFQPMRKVLADDQRTG